MRLEGSNSGREVESGVRGDAAPFTNAGKRATISADNRQIGDGKNIFGFLLGADCMLIVKEPTLWLS